MKIGFIGLGKMGSPMVECLLRDGHQVVASDVNKEAVREAEGKGAIPADSLGDLMNRLDMPRAVWLGRWTVAEAIGENVPAPIITLSLLERFRSRQQESFSNKVIAALRHEFGGHGVKKE